MVCSFDKALYSSQLALASLNLGRPLEAAMLYMRCLLLEKPLEGANSSIKALFDNMHTHDQTKSMILDITSHKLFLAENLLANIFILDCSSDNPNP